jgi:two-component system cell cycle response regulator DivK
MTNERMSEAKPDSTDRKAPRILVVDDAEDTRVLYATFLSFSGLTVEEASDGEMALDSIAKSPPDLVVMDLAMPRVDGWETTRLIKSNPRTQKVRVIVVTSNAMPDQVAKARAAGADEVLTKPCLPEALLVAVRAVLARR